jgi:hypothetical protein
MGVVVAYWLRKQPTSIRGALFWLVLVSAIGGMTAAVWLADRNVEPRYLHQVIGGAAFAFVFPIGFHYWMRFRRPGEKLSLAAFARVFVALFLVLLGFIWLSLVFGMTVMVLLPMILDL